MGCQRDADCQGLAGCTRCARSSRFCTAEHVAIELGGIASQNLTIATEIGAVVPEVMRPPVKAWPLVLLASLLTVCALVPRRRRPREAQWARKFEDRWLESETA